MKNKNTVNTQTIDINNITFNVKVKEHRLYRGFWKNKTDVSDWNCNGMDIEIVFGYDRNNKLKRFSIHPASGFPIEKTDPLYRELVSYIKDIIPVEFANLLGDVSKLKHWEDQR